MNNQQVRVDKKFVENGEKLFPHMSWPNRTKRMADLLEDILYGKKK